MYSPHTDYLPSYLLISLYMGHNSLLSHDCGGRITTHTTATLFHEIHRTVGRVGWGVSTTNAMLKTPIYWWRMLEQAECTGCSPMHEAQIPRVVVRALGVCYSGGTVCVCVDVWTNIPPSLRC